MGMAKLKYKGAVCLDRVVQDIRAASSGRHFLCVTKDVSPHLLQERAMRPRIVSRLCLRSECLLGSEEAFCEALARWDSEVAARCQRLHEAQGSPRTQESLPAFLLRLGVEAPAVTCGSTQA